MPTSAPSVRSTPYLGDGAGVNSEAPSLSELGTVLVRVAGTPGEVPCGNVRVFLTSGADASASNPLTATTNADGAATFPRLVAGSYFASTHSGFSRGGVLARSGSLELTIKVPLSCRLSVKTVDALGNAVPNANIWLSSNGNGPDSTMVALSDVNGNANLFPVSSMQWVAASAKDLAPSMRRLLKEADLGTTVQLVLQGDAMAVSGTVFLPTGAPAADAEVSIGDVTGTAFSSKAGEPLMSELIERTTTNATGTYAFAGRPRRPQFIYVSHPAAAADRVPVIPDGNALVTRDVHLKAPGVIEVDVVGAGSDGTKELAVRATAVSYAFASTLRIRGNGKRRFVGCARTLIDIAVDLPSGRTARHQVDLTTSAFESWVCDVESGDSLEGRVVSLTGEPCVSWELKVYDPDDPSADTFRATTSRDGSFKVLGLSRKEYTVDVMRDRTQQIPVQRYFSVLAPNKQLEFRIDVASHGVGFIKGRIIHPDGSPFGGVEIDAIPLRPMKGVSTNSRSDPKSGTFLMASVPNGDYEILLKPPDATSRFYGRTQVLSDGTVDLGDVVVEPSVQLVVRITQSPDPEVRIKSVVLTGENGRRVAVLDVPERQDSVTTQIAAGKYVVTGFGDRAYAPGEAVNIRSSDAVANVTLVTLTGRRVDLVLQLPKAETPTAIRVRVEDAMGRVVRDGLVSKFRGDFVFRVGLPIEACRGVVFDGERQLGRFQIPAGTASPSSQSRIVVEVVE